MNVADVQSLLATVGAYSGAIDGDAGPLTWSGVEAIEKRHKSDYVASPLKWTRKRRIIAAGQAVLRELTYEPGVIDGYAGPNTNEPFTEWRSRQVGNSPLIDRDPLDGARSHPAQLNYPHQSELPAFYGKAGGSQCTAGKVELAYPMVIAWNKSQTIRRFSCHGKLAEPLTAIFREALAHYGPAEITRLNLDVFGGCFNYRRKRGGSSLSTHAYGAAVDLNPEQNQLRWGADRAQFAKPEYEPFWAIVMAHGGTPAGYAWGKDWMHFQFARL